MIRTLKTIFGYESSYHLAFYSFIYLTNIKYTSNYSTIFNINISYQFKRFCILLRLISNVDVLWNRADVVGCIIPLTPNNISPVLKPTIFL